MSKLMRLGRSRISPDADPERAAFSDATQDAANRAAASSERALDFITASNWRVIAPEKNAARKSR